MRKITLYIGLNDKDTKLQEIDTLDAYKVVANIIGVDSTITQGRGVYTHEDGTVVFEESLVVEILDFDNTINRDWLIDKAEKIKEALNQESVAVQETEVKSELV